jgi:hypothetical protein
MNGQKGFITRFGEMVDRYRAERGAAAQAPVPARHRGWPRWLVRQMVPNIGTLLLVVVLLLTVPSLAAPLRAPAATSTSTISYQGRLADSSGNPLTGKYNLEFRIYDVPTGGVPLWTEMWTGSNAVDVSDGLFNVMLGSIDNTLASAIGGQDELYLGITVGTDSEMDPRVQLGSVPFSMQAMTVPDGSITTAKIADGAVTSTKLSVGNGLRVSGGNDPFLVYSSDSPAGYQTLRVQQGTVSSRWGVTGSAYGDPNYGTGNTFLDYSGSLELKPSGGSDSMTITQGGNVGIGTTNPSSELQVNGIVRASNLDRGYTAYGIGNGTKPNRQICKVACGGPDSDDHFRDYWIWDAGIYQTSTNGAWISIAGDAHVAACSGCAVSCTCQPYRSW